MFFNQNEKYYEWLPAYLEGDLNEAQMAQMQKRLNRDFALALEAERQRRALESLRQWAALGNPPPNAVVPNDLWARLSTRLEPEPVTQSVRQIRWTAGLGVAAVVTLAAALWLPIKPAPHSTKGVKVAATIPPAPSVKPLDESALRPPSAPPLTVSITPSALPPNLAPSSALPTTAVTNAKLPIAAPISPAAPVHGLTVTPSTPALTAKPVQMATRRIAPSLENTPVSLDATVPTLSVPASTPSAPSSDKAVGGAVSGNVMTYDNVKTANRPVEEMPASAAGKVSTDKFHAREKDKLLLDAPTYFALPASPSLAPAPQASAAMSKSFRMADGQVVADARSTHWQSALSSSVQSPLWGNDSGADQTRQALIAASKAGQLNILRDHLEEQCAESPQDITAGRMLAALYEFSGKNDLSLQQRRRLSGLVTTTGEDWFALALAEDRAGNTQAAKAAYRHALESPVPPNPSHAARARQRE